MLFPPSKAPCMEQIPFPRTVWCVCVCVCVYYIAKRVSDIDKSGFLVLKDARKCLADLNLKVDVLTLIQLCGKGTGIYI